MAAEIRILYFLEDRAQEGFIKALVDRAAAEVLSPADSLIHDIRSACGGSKVKGEFKSFLKSYQKTGLHAVDLLVVAVDGNCVGYQKRKKQLEQYLKDHPLKEITAFAVPNSHIERWYMLDQRAFKHGVGIEKAPDVPAYKCKKDYYKQKLIDALKEANVGSLLGGAEYAEKIVAHMEDLDSIDKDRTAGFTIFIQELRRLLKSLRPG